MEGGADVDVARSHVVPRAAGARWAVVPRGRNLGGAPAGKGSEKNRKTAFVPGGRRFEGRPVAGSALLYRPRQRVLLQTDRVV